MGLEQGKQLAPEPLLAFHRVGQIRPVEAGQEYRALLQPQLFHNILPYPGGGGGGQGNGRNSGEVCPQLAKVPVVGTKLVAPLGNAVGLVHGNQAQVHALQKAPKPRNRQPFRGNVQDLHPSAGGLGLGQLNRRCREGTVDESGADAVGVQRVHLVFHQGNQGRHDQGDARQANGGQLVAQRLATARGHQRQAVAPRQDVLDNLLLQGQETVVPKVFLQRPQWRQLAIHHPSIP